MLTHLLFMVVLVTSNAFDKDYLLYPVSSLPDTTLTETADKSVITLTNQLISRVFVTPKGGLWPEFATIDLLQLSTPSGISRSALRSTLPEAYVTLDNTTYSIGGFKLFNVSKETLPLNDLYLTNSFFNRTFSSVHARARKNKNAFTFKSYSTAPMTRPFPWTSGLRHSGKDTKWPPLGKHLIITFEAPPTAPTLHREITVNVHYEMYTGIPAYAKWVTLTTSDENASSKVFVQNMYVFIRNFKFNFFFVKQIVPSIIYYFFKPKK